MNALDFDIWLETYACDRNVKPLIMGILNVTPDSFSDSGKFFSFDRALAHAMKMVDEGVDIIDIGGESTRPGAKPVERCVELERVIPLIIAIRRESDICLSIDTYKSEVMEAAILEGVDIINDVSALNSPASFNIALKYQKPVCIMHSYPNLHDSPVYSSYDDFLKDIHKFLETKINALLEKGFNQNKIIIDPGIGFGKNVDQNLFLLRNIETFLKYNCPVLLGVSKKRVIGEILNKNIDDRVYGSLALNISGYMNGCRIFRTHDIIPSLDALRMASAVLSREITL